MSKRESIAEIAEKLARKPFHGKVMRMKSNIGPIISHFPNWNYDDFDGKWCAAFVYHCCRKAGFSIPPRYPSKNFGSFAGVHAWLEWAKLAKNGFYYSRKNTNFTPKRGDIVIFDNVFDPGPHDHIGIITSFNKSLLIVAEGNVNNISCVLERKVNSNIRGYIRIPCSYKFQ